MSFDVVEYGDTVPGISSEFIQYRYQDLGNSNYKSTAAFNEYYSYSACYVLGILIQDLLRSRESLIERDFLIDKSKE